MKYLFCISCGAGLILGAFALEAKDNREWETGKVLDSNSARTVLQTGATTAGGATTTVNGTASNNGYGTTSYSGTATSAGASHTNLQYMGIKETDLLIVGNQYAYVVHDRKIRAPGLGGMVGASIANRKHGCRFIVNDEVRYSQEKDKLYVQDADGKTCTLDIDKQVHLMHTDTDTKK
jgi:hypothetical protein